MQGERIGDLDPDDVGLHEGDIDRAGPPIGRRPGEHAGAVVVVGQPIDPFEGDQPRRREDADLPHGPTEPLALDPSPADEISGAGEQGPHRSAEPLRHATGDGGGVLRPLRHGGVPTPRPRSRGGRRRGGRAARRRPPPRAARAATPARRPRRGCPPRTPPPAPPIRPERRPPTAAGQRDRSCRRRPRASPPAPAALVPAAADLPHDQVLPPPGEHDGPGATEHAQRDLVGHRA